VRVVLDTNILLSAVLGAALAPVLEHWRAGQFTLIVTDEIAREYLDVLRRPKFGLPAEGVEAIGAFVFQRAEFVTPMEHLAVVAADPKDNKFLEAAVAGEAEFIISTSRKSVIASEAKQSQLGRRLLRRKTRASQ